MWSIIIDYMGVIDKSDKVKQDAVDFIARTNLLKGLARFGNTSIVGSYVLNLMLRRELDINLVVDNTRGADITGILGALFNSITPTSIDYRNRSLPETRIRVDGHWLKVKTLEGWDLDIWIITNQESERQMALQSRLQARIAESNRATILELKSRQLADPANKKRYNGALIYDAVLNNGVGDYQGLLEHLDSIGEYQGDEIDF